MARGLDRSEGVVPAEEGWFYAMIFTSPALGSGSRVELSTSPAHEPDRTSRSWAGRASSNR